MSNLKFYWHRIKYFFTKWKFINTSKYFIIPISELNRHFFLTEKEYEDSRRIKKENGEIVIEFGPGGGIGTSVYVRVIKTGERINITDYTSW